MSTPSGPGGGRRRKGSYQPVPSGSSTPGGRITGKNGRRASIAVAMQTPAPESFPRPEADDHVPELVPLTTPKIYPTDDSAGSSSSSSSVSVRPPLTKTRSRWVLEKQRRLVGRARARAGPQRSTEGGPRHKGVMVLAWCRVVHMRAGDGV